MYIVLVDDQLDMLNYLTTNMIHMLTIYVKKLQGR